MKQKIFYDLQRKIVLENDLNMMGISYFKSRTTAGSRPVDFPFKVFVL